MFLSLVPNLIGCFLIDLWSYLRPWWGIGILILFFATPGRLAPPHRNSPRLNRPALMTRTTENERKKTGIAIQAQRRDSNFNDSRRAPGWAPAARFEFTQE
jgi:hypothetical protein